jgi:hypothetical protein
MSKLRSEAPVQADIRLDAARLGVTLLRNNSGAFQNERGQWVRFGLGNESVKQNKEIKSSDLIGWRPVLVTADMIGRVLPVFAAIDAKPEGWKFRDSDDRAVAQLRFIELVRQNGGCAGFASSVREARDILWLEQD